MMLGENDTSEGTMYPDYTTVDMVESFWISGKRPNK